MRVCVLQDVKNKFEAHVIYFYSKKYVCHVRYLVYDLFFKCDQARLVIQVNFINCVMQYPHCRIFVPNRNQLPSLYIDQIFEDVYHSLAICM